MASGKALPLAPDGGLTPTMADKPRRRFGGPRNGGREGQRPNERSQQEALSGRGLHGW
jgi:hypothetical protein